MYLGLIIGCKLRYYKSCSTACMLQYEVHNKKCLQSNNNKPENHYVHRRWHLKITKQSAT